MTLVPGNHDVYTPGAARAQLFEKTFASELRSDTPDLCREGPYPIVRLLGSEAAIVALSSARVPLCPGVATGWVGEAQRAALAVILADPRLSKRAILVAVHHGPYRRNGKRDRITHGLYDGPKVMSILAKGGALGLCHGHIHHRYQVKGPLQTTVFCAGSSTQRGREGYWLYELAEGGLRSAKPFWLEGAGPPEVV